MSLPSSMADFVPCDRLLQKAYFQKVTARSSAERRKQLVVSDILLFRCSWFRYWFIKLDLVTVENFCFNFSRVLGSVVDRVNGKPSARLNHGLRDAQKVCAQTKVGTVFNSSKQ